MAILHPNPISSNFFSFKKGKFTCELSDLLSTPFTLGRVYDDACDEGFSIVSEKTGKSAVFRLIEMRRDSDGDLQSWEFVCVTPGLKNLTATIFND